MKEFVIKLLLFALVLAIVAFALNSIFITAIRTIHVGDFGVVNSIDSGRINANLLICGSSRGYVQYNPEIIEKVLGLSSYNISSNGSDLGVQLTLLKWYLDKNRLPRYVIQNIDIFMGDINSTIYEPFKYLPYLKEKSLFQGLSLIDKRWWLYRYLPQTNLLYFGKEFQKKLGKEIYQSYIKKQDNLIKGYSARRIDWNDDKYEDEYIKEHAKGFRYHLSYEYRKYLNDLVTLCQVRGIRLVLVIAPEYKKFMELQLNRQEIIDYYVELSKQKGVLLLDFSQSYIARDRGYYYNFAHMNSKGANLFSANLAAILKERLDQD